jgi:hypothetical protein
MSDLVVIQPTESALALPPTFSGAGFGKRLTQRRAMHIDLIQPTTRVEGAEPGKFRIRETGQHLDKLFVVLFEDQEKRTMYEKGSEFGASPICYSSDGITPHPNAKVPQALKCANCKQGPAGWDKWKKSKKSEDVPPCSNRKECYLMDREFKLPYIFAVSGKGVKPFEDHMAALVNYATLAEKQLGRMPNAFEFSFEINSKRMTNSKGTYYEPVFSSIKLIKPEDAQEFMKLYGEFYTRRQAGDTDEENAETSAAVDAAMSEASSGDASFNHGSNAVPKGGTITI